MKVTLSSLGPFISVWADVDTHWDGPLPIPCALVLMETMFHFHQ